MEKSRLRGPFRVVRVLSPLVTAAWLCVAGSAGADDAPLPTSEADGTPPPAEEARSRNFELLYVSADLGGSYVDLQSFSSTQLALVHSHSAGPMVGLGAGLRLVFLTLGARVRLNQLSTFSLWEVNGEIGFHLPLGRVDPYLAAHAGYAFVGTLSNATFETPGVSATTTTSSDVTVHGWDAGMSVGFDYYVTPAFSLGLDGSGSALFLKRPPVPLPADVSLLPAAQQQALRASPLYTTSGDSAGFGASVSLHAGLHLGL